MVPYNNNSSSRHDDSSVARNGEGRSAPPLTPRTTRNLLGTLAGFLSNVAEDASKDYDQLLHRVGLDGNKHEASMLYSCLDEQRFRSVHQTQREPPVRSLASSKPSHKNSRIPVYNPSANSGRERDQHKDVSNAANEAKAPADFMEALLKAAGLTAEEATALRNRMDKAQQNHNLRDAETPMEGDGQQISDDDDRDTLITEATSATESAVDEDIDPHPQDDRRRSRGYERSDMERRQRRELERQRRRKETLERMARLEEELLQVKSQEKQHREQLEREIVDLKSQLAMIIASTSESPSKLSKPAPNHQDALLTSLAVGEATEDCAVSAPPAPPPPPPPASCQRTTPINRYTSTKSGSMGSDARLSHALQSNAENPTSLRNVLKDIGKVKLKRVDIIRSSDGTTTPNPHWEALYGDEAQENDQTLSTASKSMPNTTNFQSNRSRYTPKMANQPAYTVYHEQPSQQQLYSYSKYGGQRTMTETEHSENEYIPGFSIAEEDVLESQEYLDNLDERFAEAAHYEQISSHDYIYKRPQSASGTSMLLSQQDARRQMLEDSDWRDVPYADSDTSSIRQNSSSLEFLPVTPPSALALDDPRLRTPKRVRLTPTSVRQHEVEDSEETSLPWSVQALRHQYEPQNHGNFKDREALLDETILRRGKRMSDSYDYPMSTSPTSKYLSRASPRKPIVRSNGWAKGSDGKWVKCIDDDEWKFSGVSWVAGEGGGWTRKR